MSDMKNIRTEKYWCAYNKLWIETWRTCADGKNDENIRNSKGHYKVLCWDCVYYDKSETKEEYKNSTKKRSWSF